MLNRSALFILSIAFVAAAAGCGRKGPLYLPDDTRRPPSTEQQDPASPSRARVPATDTK